MIYREKYERSVSEGCSGYQHGRSFQQTVEEIDISLEKLEKIRKTLKFSFKFFWKFQLNFWHAFWLKNPKKIRALRA